MAKKRNEAEITATRNELPQKPPEYVVEAVEARMHSQALVYRAEYYTDPLTGIKEKTALVTCTACGKTYHMSYYGDERGCACRYGSAPFGFWDHEKGEAVFSGDCCLCPECGEAAKAIHIGFINPCYCLETRYFMTIHIVRGHLVALGWRCEKLADKAGKIYWDFMRYEGIGLIDGHPVRYAGYQKNIGGSVSRFPRWEARARWRENGDQWDADEIFFVDRPAYLASEASKTALDEYIAAEQKKIRVGAYLNLWTRYPQIENLTRCGLAPYVRRVIDKATVINGYYYTHSDFSIAAASKWINGKAVKPHEIVGLEKHELRYATVFELETLEYYKQRLKAGTRLTEEQLRNAERLYVPALCRTAELAEALGLKVSHVKLINYLVKQIDLYKRERDAVDDPTILTPGYLADYWNMLVGIHGTVPPTKALPSDLEEAHDAAVRIKKDKEDAVLNAGIAATAIRYKDLAWEDPETGLIIRPAKSHKELITEGEKLHHCVTSYAKKVSAGKTCILFIRRADRPNEPFYTLEWLDGRVEQNRGAWNCKRTPEVEVFEAKWLNHIMEVNRGNIVAKKAS